MGIPRLISHLEPYAKRALLNDSEVVVDGPALAYHIYYVCIRRNQPTGPFDLPSYALLGRTAIDWLDELGKYGVTVSAIYFDGFLPEHKLPTRLGRLSSSTRELNNYYQSISAGFPDLRQHAKSASSSSSPTSPATLFSPTGGARSGRGPPVPVPAFVVPAIIDALSRSARYGAVTRIVPGEADAFCAGHARRNGGGYGCVVLTTDSDLVVYDLGACGSVVLLRDLELGSLAGTKGLVAWKFSAVNITERLAIPPKHGLRGFAFELIQDPYLSLKQLVEGCRRHAAISAHPEEYEAFTALFDVATMDSPSSWSPAVLGCLPGLDPRVSELALQCARPVHRRDDISTGLRGLGLTTGEGEAKMFLPFLLDCWTRTSAWEVSTETRLLAYSLVQLVSKERTPAVLEYRRLQATSNTGRRLEVLPSADIPDAARELLAVITHITNSLRHPELAYAVLSIHQDIEFSNRQGREPLSLLVMREEARSPASWDAASWDVLHFVAQLQGTYYSLRILAQLLDFVGGQMRRGLPGPLGELRACLATLPPISGFPSLVDVTGLPRRIRDAGGMEFVSSAYGVSFEPESIVKKKSRGREKGKQKRSPTSGRASARPSANPFDVLGG